MKFFDAFLAFLKEKNWAQILILLLVGSLGVLWNENLKQKNEIRDLYVTCERREERVRSFYEGKLTVKDTEIARCKQLAEEYRDDLIQKLSDKTEKLDAYILQNKVSEKRLEKKVDKAIKQ